MIKVALAQINPIVGDLQGNCAKICAFIKKARKKNAEMVIFPELALCGYPPEDLLHKPHFIKENKKYLNKLKKVTRGLTVLVGFVDGEVGAAYNACAIIQNGVVRDVYRKIILPNYGVFDEKRYFFSGHALSVYELDNFSFAVTICEDIWESEIVESLKNKGLDFVINISASPFHLGKAAQREVILSNAARKIECPMVYCNLVGGQDEIVFDGTSKIISSKGELIAYGKRFCEDLFVFNLKSDHSYSPVKVHSKSQEEAYSALKLGLYDYVHKNGFKKVVVGVSGGIDSAVVVSLATLSLGKENVCALLMPSEYTSNATLGDAKKICANLGIKYHIVNINDIVAAYAKQLFVHFKGRKPDTTEENLQARIRGNILMAFSNKFGYLVLNTGNKSEVSCGYCTLYGDMVGGFGVLKDVPKTLVYKLAKYINSIGAGRIIPLSTIKREPSAELKSNQKDSDTLPEYELLDPVLKMYVEKDLSSDEIIKKGFNPSMVKRVVRMVDANEYKRRQSPVGIKITPRAFGRDRRMPITNRFFK
jgi:NAD+ synthase (glutamine-hydrolysing)